MRELEAENARHKRMHAGSALERAAMKDMLSRGGDAVRKAAAAATEGQGTPHAASRRDIATELTRRAEPHAGGSGKSR
ncbi:MULTISPECIES: hypothetical protein [Cupriavidus]|uniref:hypothetical protein n=1 Tax=Cupriavidus TaxID=106589 RepID=UPI0012F4BAE7|nr:MULTISPECIES: hypothetical protein [Cupriavidus]